MYVDIKFAFRELTKVPTNIIVITVYKHVGK